MKIHVCAVCELPYDDCICDQRCPDCGLLIGNHEAPYGETDCPYVDDDVKEALDKEDLWVPVLDDDGMWKEYDGE